MLLCIQILTGVVFSILVIRSLYRRESEMAIVEVEKDKKYEYMIQFYTLHIGMIEMKLYSNYRYRDILDFFEVWCISKDKVFYDFTYRNRQIKLNKEEVILITFAVREL